MNRRVITEGAGASTSFPAKGGPPPSARREQALLEASRAVIELCLEHGTTEIPVKALAAHAGLSERTFYRYFPRKEDAIRPYALAGLQRIVAGVRAAPKGRSLRSALVAAHAEIFRASRDGRWEAFFPLVQSDDSLHAAWLQVVSQAEEAFAGVVGERLGISPTSQRARLAGAVLTLCGRLAMEQPFGEGAKRDPAQVFSECLTHLGSTLFEPLPRETQTRRRPRRTAG